MSTKQTHVVLIGLSLTTDEFDYYKEAHLLSTHSDFDAVSEEEQDDIRDNIYDDKLWFKSYDAEDTKNGIVMIDDPMSDSYHYIGIVLSRSIDDYSGLPANVLRFKDLKKKRKAFIKQMNDLNFDINTKKVSLISLTHWS